MNTAVVGVAAAEFIITSLLKNTVGERAPRGHRGSHGLTVQIV